MSHAHENKILSEQLKLHLSKRNGINASPCTFLEGCAHPMAQHLSSVRALCAAVHCTEVLVFMQGHCFANQNTEILQQLLKKGIIAVNLFSSSFILHYYWLGQLC